MKAAIAFLLLLRIFNITGFTQAGFDINTNRISDQHCHQGAASDTSEEHNCSMWAAISTNIADNVIYNHLIVYPNSLKSLSRHINIDGWGIAHYQNFGDMVTIERGAMRACNDPGFDSVVVQINDSEPEIILAHIRNCTAGCCCHGCDSIPDPHPFLRFKNNRSWSFEHNGTISKPLLFNLIGDEYLENNPLTGSGIPECDPADPSKIVDSELYFLLILKHIEENSWNTTEGILSALRELLKNSSGEAMNFVLSDGYNMWSFRKACSLYYVYNPSGNYSAVATMYPTWTQGNWRKVNDYELLVFSADEEPIIIPPTFIAGDVNGDGRIVGSDVSYALRYLRDFGPPPPDSFFNDSTGAWLYSAADANGDCAFTGLDITYLIQYFLGNNSTPKWCNQTPPVGRSGLVIRRSGQRQALPLR